MGFFRYILQDWNRNKGNSKGRFITLLFRLAAYIYTYKVLRVVFFPYLLFYRFFVEWVLGTELPWKTKIGPGLVIYHGQCLVVHKNVVIGQNCTIRHCTTVGLAKQDGGSPKIGDNVDIGANVSIVGEITVGNNVTIFVGSVVIKDIQSNSIGGGNPAKFIAN